MKTAIDYDLEDGRNTLKSYHYYIVGIGTLKSKAKVIEALNLGMDVRKKDKIMNDIFRWSQQGWVKI